MIEKLFEQEINFEWVKFCFYLWVLSIRDFLSYFAKKNHRICFTFISSKELIADSILKCFIEGVIPKVEGNFYP